MEGTVKEWALAKELAVLSNRTAVLKKIRSNWSYLSLNYDIPRVLEMVLEIWAYGAERFGLPSGSEEWQSWVNRVTEAMEHG